MSNTPETRCWILDGLVVTTVTEAGETSITLTCATPTAIDTVRAALATLATALQAAASERKRRVAVKVQGGESCI